MRKKWITAFTLTSFFILPLQGHALDTAQAAKINLQSNPIEDIVTLPIKGIRAVQSNGQTVFLSDNGRFVFTGQLYDLWYKKPLSTLADMREVSDRIDLKRMGLDIDTLNTVSLGSGPKQVVVFVDPRCHYCHALMNDAQALVKQYTFILKTVHTIGGAYSEIFIKSKSGIGVGRLIVSDFQKLLYSTHPDDVYAINQHRKRGLSVPEAIQAVLSERTKKA